MIRKRGKNLVGLGEIERGVALGHGGPDLDLLAIVFP
jgi:hypothetical protein